MLLMWGGWLASFMLVIYPVALDVWRSQKISNCSWKIYRYFFTLQVEFFFFYWQSLHSLSDDLKSHFPTSARSPVKQSADTEAKTLKITLVGVLDDHLPPHTGTVFGYPHSRSYKRRWSVLLSSSSISVLFFFPHPPSQLSKMTPNLNSSLLAHPFALGQGHLSFPSLCWQTFLFLFTPSLPLLMAFLFSFCWPQKRSVGSLGQRRPMSGFTWQGQADVCHRPDDTYWSCQRRLSTLLESGQPRCEGIDGM